MTAGLWGNHAITAAVTLDEPQDLYLKCNVFNTAVNWFAEGREMTAIRVGSLTEG